MDIAQRAVLKEQLRAMAAGRGEGIELDTPEQWVIENVREPIAFFRHLGLLVPEDSILYIECAGVVPEVAKFYETHRATKGTVCVARDMLYPVPEIFHVQLGSGVTERLIELIGRHSQERCFTHLKAYRDEKLLFAFHDAFDGSDLLVSDRIPAERIGAFCKELGATYRRERNESKRDTKVLEALLSAMENPEKVRILWPWWKKALLFWKK
jgi:hypothetical protein